MSHPARRRIERAEDVARSERVRKQIAELEACLGQPMPVGSLKGTALDPDAYDPRCWACIHTPGLSITRGGGQGGGLLYHDEPCRICDGTAIRPDAPRCDDCHDLLFTSSDALCEPCKALPRCRHCATRLDDTAAPGTACDDCRYDRQRENDPPTRRSSNS